MMLLMTRVHLLAFLHLALIHIQESQMIWTVFLGDTDVMIVGDGVGLEAMGNRQPGYDCCRGNPAAQGRLLRNPDPYDVSSPAKRIENVARSSLSPLHLEWSSRLTSNGHVID